MAADGSAPTSWRAANLGLLALAVVLLVTSVLLLTRGATAAPGDAEARRLAARYAGVTRAARAETQAFLGVDYRDPDPQVERVLAGATGAFAQQYSRGRSGLVASARRTHAVSTGRVVSVGVRSLQGDRATVLLAASSRVTNRSTGQKPQPRYYRLQLTLVRHGDRWLTSALRFVG